jgi:hypothetical protein
MQADMRSKRQQRNRTAGYIHKAKLNEAATDGIQQKDKHQRFLLLPLVFIK